MLPRPVHGIGGREKLLKRTDCALLQAEAVFLYADCQRLCINSPAFPYAFPGKSICLSQAQIRALQDRGRIAVQAPCKLGRALKEAFPCILLSVAQIDAVTGKPVCKIRASFKDAARKKGAAALLKSLDAVVGNVLADDAVLQKGLCPGLHGMQSFCMLKVRLCRQNGHGLQVFQGALAVRIKKAHVFQRIAEKLKAQRKSQAWGKDIHDVAAPSHLAGPGNKGRPGIAKGNELLQEELLIKVCPLFKIN